MLTEIEVKNFRGIRSLEMNDLGRITLVGGRNGVGKTALLEALWTLGTSDLPAELTELIGELRGLPTMGPYSGFHDLFFDYDIGNRIRIAARNDREVKSEWALEVFLEGRRQIDVFRADNPNQPNSASMERLARPQFESETQIVFKYHHNDGYEYNSRAWWFQELVYVGTAIQPRWRIRQERNKPIPDEDRVKAWLISVMDRENLHSLASLFSDAQLQGGIGKILPLLRLLEPRLEELTLITINNVPVIHARLKGVQRLTPVQLLGEGLNRVLGFALWISEVSGGILLIDEIENGLHYRVQEEMFSLLLKLAKAFDVQIIATTHSRECINAAHHALNRDGQEELAYYRLDNRVGEGVKAYHFDAEMLETSIEFGMEPR